MAIFAEVSEIEFLEQRRFLCSTLHDIW